MRILLLIGLLVATPAMAQDHDHEAMHDEHHGPAEVRSEVRAVVDALFDGMRAGDSTAVGGLFMAGTRLVTTFSRDGVPGARVMPINQFVAAVGSPHDVVWDERIWGVRIDVRDNLASAWMDYAFFAGEQFSHCGVNAMQFARDTDGAWKLIHLADTRRPAEECDLPDDVR